MTGMSRTLSFETDKNGNIIVDWTAPLAWPTAYQDVIAQYAELLEDVIDELGISSGTIIVLDDEQGGYVKVRTGEVSDRPAVLLSRPE